MHIILSALLVFFLQHTATAQLLPIQYDTLERSHEIIVSGAFDYSGSALQNAVTSKFIRGGVITSEIKDASFDRHKRVNRFGGSFSADAEYRNYNIRPFKKREWGMVFKAGAFGFGGALYSDDAYGLTFYGNERYIGDTIDMSGLSMGFTSMQKIGVGFIDVKTKSSISLNFYNVSNRVSANFRDLDIIQSPDGQNVEMVIDGDVESRDNLKFVQGLGVGFDIDFKLPIMLKEGQTAYVQFLLKNIGFAHLFEEQKVYSVDTSFTYSGFQFEDLIGDNAIVFDSVDVLDTLGITSSTKKRTILLPGFIQIGKMVDSHNDHILQSFFGVRLYPTLIYSPYVYAGMHVKANDWLYAGINVGYGGFSNFRGGFYTGVNFDHISAGVGTENLVGVFSKKGNGQSLYLRIRCVF